ncbi:MAG: type II toxin-antitoxin system HigB family toxin [Pyrinomonadaceae bacterium]|jgi:mRNA interferase HigB|nr:type II toxin-antitoxin system HigB family toxin [Acidobacteriota bacterium]
MHIISRKRLREFSEKNPDAKQELDAWFKIANKAEWRSIVDLKRTYRHADPVGTCTVFNIRRNRFRLIVKIEYRIQRIYIKHVLTHAEYDRGEWKKDCGS